MELKNKRQQAMAEARRGIVMRAVRSAIAEGGVQGANVRDIARRAGYTPGALYAYFPGKQALFAAVLQETLQGAQAAAQQAKVPKNNAGSSILHVRAHAWFAYFSAHPSEAGLVLHLLAQDTTDPEQLAQTHHIVADLLQSLAPVSAALGALGCPDAQLPSETMALLSAAMGALLLRDARRLSALNALALQSFATHLDHAAARWAMAPALTAEEGQGSTPAQVDLFG
ncbi:TetR/AcrR family transcriptional regulator [Rhodoferax saidenbachensis]|uniref:AcrR family transcriptional regulator n=1 Tax=Rhodoferax saidenbachensis TaxID=1484693 RepID=A0ABU1ZLQ4_9BURK|nr:TetR/AcrR family transcriptional regulator [Rhodoferax saidenbachensis]MDR7305491.1 AcrR family transcriptional regulator [Rhodoferax saidenbachensis]